MKIMVDADACPVKELIIGCAKKHGLEVVMVCDVAHMLFYNEDFVNVVTVDLSCWQKKRRFSITTVSFIHRKISTVCSLSATFPAK